MEKLFDYYKELENDRLSFIFNGDVSDDITDGIIRITEFNVNNFDALNKLSRRISFIMVECFQNVVRHGKNPGEEKEKSEGLFAARLLGDANYVSSINMIDVDEVEKLREKLNQLNSIEKDKLKALYLEVLNNEELSAKGGAGLGLIQLARKAGQPISYDFENLNEQLANFYGIETPKPGQWQAVAVGDTPRGGVLTMGATLLKTSYPRRTSPVLRGGWVLEHLLGSPVPPPPPDVPALEEQKIETSASFREQLEKHREDPKCASCHNRMDPLGFGLERFDAVGRFRSTESGKPIDSSGRLPSGQTFDGASELKQILLTRRSEFEKNLSRRLLGFALGRELNKFDECVIDDCQKALQRDQGRSSAVIKAIVTSYPFQHRFYAAK